VLLGRAQPRGEVVGALENSHLLVEAVEEANVAGLVGDLGGEEDPLLLGGAGPHDRPQLVGDALLADEEGGEAIHALESLLRLDPLVPVGPVPAEVEVLGGPLLALPELIELPVGEEHGLSAVGRILKCRIRGLQEALLLRDRAQRLGGPALGARFVGLSLGTRFHFDSSPWRAGKAYPYDWPAGQLRGRVIGAEP
jgi:hypothetical protein